MDWTSHLQIVLNFSSSSSIEGWHLDLHIEKSVTKALGTYIITYSIFRSKHLSTNIKLIVYKALIRSIMNYASPTWAFAVDTHLMKLRRLQNRILRATGKLYRRPPVRDLHLAFKISYVYDYITKLCRRQAEVILNRKNPNVRSIGQREARHRKHKWLKLGGVKSTTVQVSDCRFWGLNRLLHSRALRVRVTLRLKVSQSVCLGVEPRLGLMTRY
jgi:hypothetical protein